MRVIVRSTGVWRSLGTQVARAPFRVQAWGGE